MSGYKTYIVAFLLAVFGIYQICNGQTDAGIQSILGAATAAGLRHSVTTEAAK